VFAPGDNISSAWIGDSNSSIGTISGTSMACPHVAGLAAYLMSLEGISGVQNIAARIKTLTTTGQVSNAGTGTVDLLIFNGVGNIGSNSTQLVG
jgi:oryzin